MRIERVAVNYSPLITLFRSGLHPLLPQLFPDLVVPEAVWTEVVSSTYDDPATRGLPESAWARREQTPISADIVAWNLGAGETAVLSFVQYNSGYTAIVNDRAARRCARVLRIPILGTAGVVVLAKRRGLINSVEDGLRRLQSAATHLSRDKF